ncbi:MAG TPA: exonuclease, partial [Blastocatellia bacterium]|nr:exonuclease [Blastocatellia bacterium]
MSEVYVSTDVETDGPIPGLNSMLSFGSAAYLPDKTLISAFTANLETLPGAAADPKTMAWWETQPEAWKA